MADSNEPTGLEHVLQKRTENAAAASGTLGGSSAVQWTGLSGLQLFLAETTLRGSEDLLEVSLQTWDQWSH